MLISTMQSVSPLIQHNHVSAQKANLRRFLFSLQACEDAFLQSQVAKLSHEPRLVNRGNNK